MITVITVVLVAMQVKGFVLVYSFTMKQEVLFPHLVEEEDLGHCSQYPGSSQDLQDELHAAMGLIGESGENSEKLTCQPEHHTTSTKSQLNIEKLSEEIFERFSAKFQDSSIAKDIAREVVKLLDTSNEQECQHKKENVWHDGGDDKIICIPCSVFSSHEKVPKELRRFHKHGFGTFTKISETASIQTNKDRSKRINAHLESPLHVWCTNFSKLEAENEEKRKTTNEKLCTKIVTNAIYCFRTSGSSYDFVRLNNKDELTAEVFGESATKNDGREQFFELRNIVFDKLSDYIKRLFQTLKTASFSLDKVTVGGVPYTVLVTYYFYNGQIHCVLNNLHVMRSYEYSGEETANMIGLDLMESLGLTRRQISEIFGHIAYDGVYASKKERTRYKISVKRNKTFTVTLLRFYVSDNLIFANFINLYLLYNITLILISRS